MPKRGKGSGTRKKISRLESIRSKAGLVQRKPIRRRGPAKTKRTALKRVFFIAVLLILSFVLGYYIHEHKHESKRSLTVVSPGTETSRRKHAETPPEVKEPSNAGEKAHSKGSDGAHDDYAYIPPVPSPTPPELPIPKVPEVVRPELKTLCLILDDFGYNFGEDVRKVLDLDPAINIAILPGHVYSRKVMDYAVDGKHEVLIHAPLESPDGCTESHCIKRGDTEERVTTLLSQWFKELPAALGINNHQGSLATADRDTMMHVISFLKGRNKVFIDSLTASNSQGYRLAWENQVLCAKRTVPFLDNEDGQVEIKHYVDLWLAQANGRNTQAPLAIAHITKKNTRKALLELIPGLREKGYKLLPLSQVVKQISIVPKMRPDSAAKVIS